MWLFFQKLTQQKYSPFKILQSVQNFSSIYRCVNWWSLTCFVKVENSLDIILSEITFEYGVVKKKWVKSVSSCYVLHTMSNKFKAVENVINRKFNALDVEYGMHSWYRIFKLFSRFCINTHPVNMIKLRSVCIGTRICQYLVMVN